MYSPIVLLFLCLGIVYIQNIVVKSQIPENGVGIDTASPIIYKLEAGSDRSHFGWTVALAKSWLFIGDPRGNSTDKTYSNIKEPGVVWRCSIVTSENYPDCHIMHLDPIDGTCSEPKYDKAKCKGVKPAFEYHNDNWVGGILSSSQSRIVTCAHRWYRGPKPKFPEGKLYPVMNGLCYWFNKETMYSSWAQPTSVINLNNMPNYGYHRLIPFFRDDHEEGQYFKANPEKDPDPDLAFAQIGFSTHLSESPDGKNELLMGSPGVRLWAGAVTQYIDAGTTPRRYKMVYKSGANFAYFGYAVTSGQYFKKGEVLYAAGSPRAERLIGRVDLFEFSNSTDGSSWTTSPVGQTKVLMNPTNQFGSYFGSVLTSANVNQDELNLDELFVGAPFIGADESSQSIGDHGAVFVYYRSNSKSDDFPYITLKGLNTPGSRFGSAIASLGDINEDGYNDIAIGAPYEGIGGAVYIFYGKKNIEINWKYGLRISADKYTSEINFRGFGCSFSNPIDIDGNGTPDFAIGSYLSKSIAIFRTRPILNIAANFSFYTDSSTDIPISTVDINVDKFTVQICIRLTGKYLPPKLEIESNLTVDKYNKRFKFQSESNPRKNISEMSTNVDSCEKLDVVLSKKETPAKNEHFPPIVFQISVEYKGAKVDKSPIRIFNITGNGAVNATPNSGAEQFCASCPFPASKQETKKLHGVVDCKDVNQCKPELNFQGWIEDLYGQKNVTSVILDWNRQYKLYISVLNSGEPAFDSKISIHLNGERENSQTPKFSFRDLPCKFEAGRKHMFTCSLEEQIKRNGTRLIPIPFTLEGIYLEKYSEYYGIHVTDSSKLDAKASRASYEMGLNVICDLKINLTGSVASPSELVSAGYLFHQNYVVLLEGQSPVSMLNLKFQFPVTSEALPGVKLLIESPEGKNLQCSGQFTDLGFSKANTEPYSEVSVHLDQSSEFTLSQSRRRREVVPDEPLAFNKDKAFIWKSSEPGIEFIEAHCVLRNIHPEPGVEFIRFLLKLDASVTEEMLSGKNLLLLESFGEVYLFNEKVTSNFSQTLVKLKANLSPVIPLGVYIGSGIGGIILLFLIVFGLYKAGFFKRATKEQLEELKAQTEVLKRQSIVSASRRASLVENIELETCKQD